VVEHDHFTQPEYAISGSSVLTGVPRLGELQRCRLRVPSLRIQR